MKERIFFSFLLRVEDGALNFKNIPELIADIFNAGEKGYMIGMAMPIKLSPDYV